MHRLLCIGQAGYCAASRCMRVLTMIQAPVDMRIIGKVIPRNMATCTGGVRIYAAAIREQLHHLGNRVILNLDVARVTRKSPPPARANPTVGTVAGRYYCKNRAESRHGPTN